MHSSSKSRGKFTKSTLHVFRNVSCFVSNTHIHLKIYHSENMTALNKSEYLKLYDYSGKIDGHRKRSFEIQRVVLLEFEIG